MESTCQVKLPCGICSLLKCSLRIINQSTHTAPGGVILRINLENAERRRTISGKRTLTVCCVSEFTVLFSSSARKDNLSSVFTAAHVSFSNVLKNDTVLAPSLAGYDRSMTAWRCSCTKQIRAAPLCLESTSKPGLSTRAARQVTQFMVKILSTVILVELVGFIYGEQRCGNLRHTCCCQTLCYCFVSTGIHFPANFCWCVLSSCWLCEAPTHPSAVHISTPSPGVCMSQSKYLECSNAELISCVNEVHTPERETDIAP